jgi:hypothetical protein
MDRGPSDKRGRVALGMKDALRRTLQSSGFPVWVAVIGCLTFSALGRRVRFLREAEAAIPPWVNTAVGWVFAILLAVLVLARMAKFVVRNARRVVPAHQQVPTFFGVSYFDRGNSSFVCHLVPLNLIVGAYTSVRLHMKKGLGVTVGTQSRSKPRN